MPRVGYGVWWGWSCGMDRWGPGAPSYLDMGKVQEVEALAPGSGSPLTLLGLDPLEHGFLDSCHTLCSSPLLTRVKGRWTPESLAGQPLVEAAS